MSLEELTQTQATAATGWTLIGSSDIAAVPRALTVSAGGRIWGLECGLPSRTMIVSDDGLTWSGNANLPFRVGAAACVHDNVLYVSGGLDKDDQETSDVLRCSDGVTWTRTQASWPARSRHCMVSYQGKLMVFCGRSGDDVYFQDMWTSPDGVTWTQEGASPGILISGVAAVVNKQVCALGGSQAPVQWYDGRTWRDEPAPWAGQRGNPSIAVLGDRLYVLGGQAGRTPRKDMWSCTGISNWRPEPDAPWAGDLYTPGCGALGGGLVAFGGCDASGKNNRDIYRFTPA